MYAGSNRDHLGEPLLNLKATQPWSGAVTPHRINHRHAGFISTDVKIHLYLLSFLNTEMAYVVEILPHVRQDIVKNMFADELAPQGSKTSSVGGGVDLVILEYSNSSNRWDKG